MLNTKQTRTLLKYGITGGNYYSSWTNHSFKKYKHQSDKRNMCFIIDEPLSQDKLSGLVSIVGCKRAKQTPGHFTTGSTYLRLIGVKYGS